MNKFMLLLISAIGVTAIGYGGYHMGREKGRWEGEKVGSLCALYDLGLVESITEDSDKSERSVTLRMLDIGANGIEKSPKAESFAMRFPYFDPRWYPLVTTKKGYSLKTEVVEFVSLDKKNVTSVPE